MSKKIPDWEKYERLIAQTIRNQLSTDYCVTPNASLLGRISSRKRQIDVLIDSRHDTENQNRIIIDAKIKSRKIDINNVEAFIGLMDDVGATHGYLICPNGFTKSAEQRAQDAISLRLLPLDKLENFDPSTWPSCSAKSQCKGRIFWDGYSTLDVPLIPVEGKTNNLEIISYIHYVGKCDKCRNFHVKCVECGEMLTPRYDLKGDVGVQCKCGMPWFWLASIECDENGLQSAELHLIEGLKANIKTVSRRTL